MKHRGSLAIATVALLAIAWMVQPISEAVGAAMRARITNTVKVKESGSLVRKIFSREMGANTRHGASFNLKKYKTVRVAVYQTTATGSSSGPPIETNYICGGPPQNRLGVDVEFGKGTEGGVTAGNNILEVDEPPSLTNRSHLYVGEFPVMRPQFGVDLCNHSNNPINVDVFLYAFRN